MPKVMVACPTYDGNEYCFQKWIDSTRALTFFIYRFSRQTVKRASIF